jgi:hypothetical protein
VRCKQGGRLFVLPRNSPWYPDSRAARFSLTGVPASHDRVHTLSPHLSSPCSSSTPWLSNTASRRSPRSRARLRAETPVEFVRVRSTERFGPLLGQCLHQRKTPQDVRPHARADRRAGVGTGRPLGLTLDCLRVPVSARMTCQVRRKATGRVVDGRRLDPRRALFPATAGPGFRARGEDRLRLHLNRTMLRRGAWTDTPLQTCLRRCAAANTAESIQWQCAG